MSIDIIASLQYNAIQTWLQLYLLHICGAPSWFLFYSSMRGVQAIQSTSSKRMYV